MELYIRRTDKEVPLPSYAKDGDAALDLRAAREETIPPGERRILSTGVHVAIPEGYAGLVWDRSGLAARHGIHVMAGVIDSGYRGEIGVVAVNLGGEDFQVRKSDRVAQLLIQPVARVDTVEVDELPESVRGETGFGSTGVK